jgi:hypothetical protein
MQRLEADLHKNLATVRISPWGVKMLEAFASPFVRAPTRIESEADAKAGMSQSCRPASICCDSEPKSRCRDRPSYAPGWQNAPPA